jgi:antitoxin FitA
VLTLAEGAWFRIARIHPFEGSPRLGSRAACCASRLTCISEPPVGGVIDFDIPFEMAQLLVRNLPEDLVIALKRRAAKHYRSAEQEHREILQAALQSPSRPSLAEVLAAMPDVGKDEDFIREQAPRGG